MKKNFHDSVVVLKSINFVPSNRAAFANETITIPDTFYKNKVRTIFTNVVTAELVDDTQYQDANKRKRRNSKR